MRRTRWCAWNPNAQWFRDRLRPWAARELARHRAFHSTFLFGCSSAHHEGIPLRKLGGGGSVMQVRRRIGEFAGIVVGVELACVELGVHMMDAMDEDY